MSRRFIIIVIQLALLLVVANVYLIEDTYGFREIAPFVFGGFVVHALLPLQYRAPFFLLVSMAAFATLLGLPRMVLLLVIGLLLIGICHLPVSKLIRAGLLLAVGGVLALVRVETIEIPMSGVATTLIPIIAAMFMFRIALYLYALDHEPKPVTIWQRLSYFFLLPNVCFPLFPVVDYQNFKRTYFNIAELVIYQKGVRWIARGIVQLLLYRIVYYYLTPNPEDISTLAGIAEYMLSAYLLYLRISGMFHLILGMLCLFGYNLPISHDRYYLAMSFNDFWRRINIYWKDFMTKMVYYPLFMRLRGLGTNRAMVIATMLSLILSWALHTYQWFWLLGKAPFLIQDAVFWTMLGIMVSINSLNEMKYGKGRLSALSTQKITVHMATVTAVKTVSMFVFMCILWSFWTSTTVSEWTSVASVAANVSLVEWLIAVAILVGAVVIGIIYQLGWIGTWFADETHTVPFRRDVIVVSSTAIFLLLLSTPAVHMQFGDRVSEFVGSIKGLHLNERDQQRLTRGYYEELLGVDTWGSGLWEIKRSKPLDWGILGGIKGAVKYTNDLCAWELLPNAETMFKGDVLKTNRWGMRDQDYEKEKPDGVYRIAILGPSYAMAPGVGPNETFEAVLEDRLNAEHNGGAWSGYQILNFGVSGFSTLCSYKQMETLVFDFEPDAIFLVAVGDVEKNSMRLIAAAVKNNRDLRWPWLKEIVAKAGLENGAELEKDEITRKLKPYSEEILRWSYRRITEASRKNGAVPVWMFMSTTNQTVVQAKDAYEEESVAAREEGFHVISVHDAYGDVPRNNLKIAPWDGHPNAQGHHLLADSLYRRMVESEYVLGAGVATPDTQMRTTPDQR